MEIFRNIMEVFAAPALLGFWSLCSEKLLQILQLSVFQFLLNFHVPAVAQRGGNGAAPL